MLNWQAGLRFLWQTPCPLCQRSTGQSLCRGCTEQLQASRLAHPGDTGSDDFPILAWGRYQDALKRAIAALKYQHQAEIAEPLGRWLGETWRSQHLQTFGQQALNSLVVVPIPLHRDRLQKRGYNQATLIAQHFCRATGLRLQERLLKRHRPTEAQFKLSIQQRRANLQDAFSVSASPLPSAHRPTQVLLLDDIYTTGATAAAAVQALKQAQLPVLGMVVVAKAEQFSGGQ